MLFGRALSDLSHLSSEDIDAARVDAHLVSHPTRTPRLSCLVLDFTITATYFVTAIGAQFQRDDDILGHRDTKTQRRTRFT